MPALEVKVAIASLEVLTVLLKEDHEFAQKEDLVRMTIKRISNLLELNQQNMDFIMPAIATFLELRDKTFDVTMKTIEDLPS